MNLLAGLLLFALTTYKVFEMCYHWQLALAMGLGVWFIYWLIITLFYEW